MDVFTCSECNKDYTLLINLRRHAKTSHPEKVDIIAPHKTYKYECEPCNKKFNHLRDFKCHKNKHRVSTEVKTVSKHKCPLCSIKGSKVNLAAHYETFHNFLIKANIFEFCSFEDFNSWKSEVENNTKAQFVKERGTVSFKNKTIIKYSCHRSGYYVSKGKGLRRLKRKGSNKINGFCPASMTVHIHENNIFKVSFIEQHVGHENEEVGNKSLMNIKKKWNNRPKECVPTENSGYGIKLAKDEGFVPPVTNIEYDTAVAEGKEYIISQLIPHLYKVAENIVCIEQINEFKKLCSPIASAIAAIGNRFTEIRKPVPYL